MVGRVCVVLARLDASVRVASTRVHCGQHARGAAAAGAARHGAGERPTADARRATVGADEAAARQRPGRLQDLQGRQIL